MSAHDLTMMDNQDSSRRPTISCVDASFLSCFPNLCMLTLASQKCYSNYLLVSFISTSCCFSYLKRIEFPSSFHCLLILCSLCVWQSTRWFMAFLISSSSLAHWAPYLFFSNLLSSLFHVIYPKHIELPSPFHICLYIFFHFHPACFSSNLFFHWLFIDPSFHFHNARFSLDLFFHGLFIDLSFHFHSAHFSLDLLFHCALLVILIPSCFYFKLLLCMLIVH